MVVHVKDDKYDKYKKQKKQIAMHQWHYFININLSALF